MSSVLQRWVSLWSAFWRVLYTCLVYCTQGVVCYVTAYPVSFVSFRSSSCLYPLFCMSYPYENEINTVAFVFPCLWPCLIAYSGGTVCTDNDNQTNDPCVIVSWSGALGAGSSRPLIVFKKGFPIVIIS